MSGIFSQNCEKIHNLQELDVEHKSFEGHFEGGLIMGFGDPKIDFCALGGCLGGSHPIFRKLLDTNYVISRPQR